MGTVRTGFNIGGEVKYRIVWADCAYIFDYGKLYTDSDKWKGKGGRNRQQGLQLQLTTLRTTQLTSDQYKHR